MYGPRVPGEDADHCECTMGNFCAFHAKVSADANEALRASMRAQGLNPDASVQGLEDIVFAVNLSDALSQNQKDAIMRILFPVPR